MIVIRKRSLPIQCNTIIRRINEKEFNLNAEPSKHGYKHLSLWKREDTTAEARIAYAVKTIKELKPGKYLFIDHPGLDTPEMRAIWHIGQAMMIVSVAGDKDARILPDVYHMFRGGSSFDTLKMIDGSMIEIFHLNDYISSKSREQQNDSDRVYPGDGAAPFTEIISRLRMMGGEKVLSLELFNEKYWKGDPLAIAKQGILKMKEVVAI